ncbi:hypothetical protein Tco_0171463, partial [Tanacetum coccineum]
ECAETMNKSNVVTSKVYKLDLQPLPPRIKNNRETHIDYLKVTQEHTGTLRDIVEQARALKPLDNSLNYACKTRKVKFSESCDTSKDKTQKQIKPQEKQATNNSVLPSTGGSCSTESSGSQTKSNTKKNRITRTSRSNKKNNKVEDQPRIVKSSLNNVNHVSNTPCNANVKHFMLNVNSELICATFNECMFDVIHDSCVHVYLNGVNARVMV